MRFWLSKKTAIPIREQLSAQLILGILSGRLSAGEKLPSVRELARRLHVHANTISAVYQDLADRGWVMQRHGSGVFVSENRVARSGDSVEAFARACLEEGLARGFKRDELAQAFSGSFRQADAVRFLLVDPDIELARVLATEVQQDAGIPVASSGLDGLTDAIENDTCLIATSAHSARIGRLARGSPVRWVQLKSMQDVIAGRERPAAAVLIGVVSRSESILRWSSTLFCALGFSSEAVIFRNPLRPHWTDGLTACDMVVADVVSAQDLPRNMKPTIFRLIREESLAELRHAVTLA